jgi:hypothetical protein
MLNSPLKLEDGQIYLSMKEYVVFVRFILKMHEVLPQASARGKKLT